LEAFKFKQESEEWDRTLDSIGIAKEQLEVALSAFADPVTGVIPPAVRTKAFKQYDASIKKISEENPRVAFLLASDFRKEGFEDQLIDDVLGKKEEKQNTVFRTDLLGEKAAGTEPKRFTPKGAVRELAGFINTLTPEGPKDPSLKKLTTDERINAKLRQAIREANTRLLPQLLEEHGIKSAIIGEPFLGDQSIERIINDIRKKGEQNMTVIFRGLRGISHADPGSPIVG
jgi:hypothetical protein